MICILGMGYVGLTLAVHLAGNGHKIVGVDVDTTKVLLLQGYTPTITEPGLDVALRNVRDNLTFSGEVPVGADLYIVCVGTPKNHTLDAIEAVLASLPDAANIVLRSTVPVGTTATLREKYKARSFTWIFAPERTLAGQALRELKEHTQLWAGDWHPLMISVFDKNYYIGEATNDLEAVKLLDNAWRDFQFAFANKFAEEGETQGFDAWLAIELAQIDYNRTIVPTPGFTGGACLSKDPYMLFGPETFSRIINEVTLPAFLKRAGYRRDEHSLGILGHAFKAFTDDTRGGPVELMRSLGYEHKWYDPQVPGPWTFEDILKCDFVVIANNNPIWSKLDYSSRKGKLLDMWNCTGQADFILGVPNAVS